MIGSLMYLTSSRPDIMFAVCACARFQVTPKTSRLLAVKRIFRYLKGKPTLGLWYSRDSPFELVVYTDSDYARATLDSNYGEYVATASCCGQNQKHLGMSKEVGTPRYLSLAIPLKKVGDEAIHKKLGSGLRCQDTILGDVNAQTRFEITSKQSKDPPLSRGYTLGSGEDSMKLLELMKFCTQLSYKNRKSVLVITGLLKLMLLSIQFLLLVYINAAKLKLGSVNAVRHILMLPVQVTVVEDFGVTYRYKQLTKVRQLQALVDKKRVIITESSIRRDLHLDDAEGTDFLPTATIFEEQARIGIQIIQPDSLKIPLLINHSYISKPKKKQPSKKTQRQKAEVSQDETEHEESVPTPSNHPQPSGEDSMANLIDLRRGSRDLDRDDDVTLVDETQERQDDELMFDTRVLDADEMLVEAKDDEKDEQSKKEEQSTKPDASTAGEAVTTASVEDSAAPTTIEEITLAQTLIQIKAAKPKVVITAATTTTTIRPEARGVVVQELSEFRALQEAQPSISKDKGKGIMIEPEIPLKRKDQIPLDEQIARDIQAKLDAELIEEQKLARKQEEEANISLIESWENTQATMDADRLLAERI
ncbi:hypothetical protein Tco_1493401 [Tanacetum coccineum]